jgi:hypothetical protein
MKAQSKETATEGAKEVQINEVERLKAQVKELNERLQSQPQTLVERIQYFKTKDEQIKRLNTLEGYADTITTVLGEVEKASQEDGFFSDVYSLKVLKKSGYSSEQELLKIRNPKVIGEVLQFALDSINTKKSELQTLINA